MAFRVFATGLISTLFLVLYLTTKPCSTAKILLVVQHYHSHAQVVATVGDELHSRGHHVVMVAAQAIKSLSSKDFKVKYYQTPVGDKDLADCTTQSLKDGDTFLSACNKHFRDDILAFSNGKELLDQLKRQHFGNLSLLYILYNFVVVIFLIVVTSSSTTYLCSVDVRYYQSTYCIRVLPKLNQLLLAINQS